MGRTHFAGKGGSRGFLEKKWDINSGSAGSRCAGGAATRQQLLHRGSSVAQLKLLFCETGSQASTDSVSWPISLP